ncbi:MAG: hypothetical protein EOP87_10530, partial [Verrucomicrobiaceae bacterium]
MKFPRVAMFAGFAAWTSSVAFAEGPFAPGSSYRTKPGAPSASGADTTQKPAPPARPVEELIRDLAAPAFRTREDATRSLWGLGDSALSALQQAAKAKDPEQAIRARELIRKIQLFITPDTDPAVTAMVERYEKATLNEKLDLFA